MYFSWEGGVRPHSKTNETPCTDLLLGVQTTPYQVSLESNYLDPLHAGGGGVRPNPTNPPPPRSATADGQCKSHGTHRHPTLSIDMTTFIRQAVAVNIAPSGSGPDPAAAAAFSNGYSLVRTNWLITLACRSVDAINSDLDARKHWTTRTVGLYA